jgi:sulfide:quinone oxidoreductase
MTLNIKQQSAKVSTTGQIALEDLAQIHASGFRTIVINRPDAEAGGLHPQSESVRRAAANYGLTVVYLPVIPTAISDEQVKAFGNEVASSPGPVLAYCASGNRSSSLFARSGLAGAERNAPQANPVMTSHIFDVVIIGAGAAGVGVASSLLRRRPELSVALVDASETHAYQPAWTLVGAGEFEVGDTVRAMQSVIPSGATWLKTSASKMMPESKEVLLANGQILRYGQLIVCPGLRLAWERVEGLEPTLGRNGVTSNYRRDLAPYTWELVQRLKAGKALFSQPPMPIKCAGAPQKAMYLSCDHWFRTGVLKNIEVEFDLAGPALFGVATFVPALMKYIEKYGTKLVFNSTLVKVDGPAKTAWFDVKQPDGSLIRESRSFDMLHVVPPQMPPDFVKASELADAAGWCEVDHATLQSPRFPDVFSLGDVCSAPNAKTVAAVRKQVVVVAENLLAHREGKPMPRRYDGYGACPMTVERGKVVLAEFGYGGKLLPTFPLRPDVPRRSAWWLKASVLPWVYWSLLLKGREWLTDVARA